MNNKRTKNKRTSRRNKTSFAESQKHFNDCMVTVLSKLLEKYSAEGSVVQSLTLMPQLMTVEAFNPATNKKKLNNLLEITISIYKRGTRLGSIRIDVCEYTVHLSPFDYH